MPSILEVTQLDYSYQQKPVLTQVDFTMEALDFVAIIGPNGGGKSTLVKLIMGLLRPSSGNILLFGQTPQKGRTHVGYLSQSSAVDLDYPIKVIDVVLTSRLSRSFWHRFTSQDRQDALYCLEQVGIAHLQNRALSALSGGEKQRVLIARALLNSPQLLILDEPTASIDPHAEQEFYQLLQELNKRMAILMVSHDIGAVSQLVKKVACLNQKLVYHNSKELHHHDLEEAYGCPVELIAHGVPHRILDAHE